MIESNGVVSIKDKVVVVVVLEFVYVAEGRDWCVGEFPKECRALKHKMIVVISRLSDGVCLRQGEKEENYFRKTYSRSLLHCVDQTLH